MQKRSFDAVVIGGGPVGSYLSMGLSKAGYDTSLVEEHCEIGRPVHCAGLVNTGLFELDGLNDIKENVVLNTITGADVHSPSGNVLDLRGTTPKAYSINRAVFDKELFVMSIDAGMDPLMPFRVLDIKWRSGRYEIIIKGISGKDSIRTDHLFGCDGSASIVRRSLGLDRPLDVVPGMNIEVELKCGRVPQDIVSVYTGTSLSKGLFAWALPAGGERRARIGVASKGGKDLRGLVRRFFREDNLRKWLSIDKGCKHPFGEISWGSGSIPMGMPRQLMTKNALLIGDAAGMAKPTSGGGIYPGLQAVDLFLDTLDINGSLNNATMRRFISDWSKGYGRELEKARVFRKIISEIRDTEIDLAIERLSRPETLSLINEKGDIDHPMGLGLALIKQDPGLLKLIPRFLPMLRGIL